MRALQVGGVLLAVLCAPVVLAVAGPGWLFVATLLVSGTAVFGAELGSRHAQDRLDAAPGSGAWEELGSRAPTRGDVVGDVEDPVVGVTCSDEELCWAWRRSFAELQRTTDAAGVARLAAQRRGYLDELERRHPARFAAWISSGARAGGDPHPFIHPRRTP